MEMGVPSASVAEMGKYFAKVYLLRPKIKCNSPSIPALVWFSDYCEPPFEGKRAPREAAREFDYL